MSMFLYITVFIFGLCAGSFLNCVIYRLEKGKSFTKGRSFCPKCKHVLNALDLIPVVSFLMLRGKCRYCKKKISSQYLLVEIFTGLLFVLIFGHLTFGFDLSFDIWILTFLYLLTIACFLIIIFIYDLKHYIIPDKIIYPAIGLAFLYRIVNLETLQTAFIAGIAAAAFFFLIWLISKGKWMGFGDVKLAFFMGLFLGWPGILVGLFSAFLIGSAVGIALILLAKKKLKSEVPFGPFLITGTFLALFWGQHLINWYLSLLN